MRHSTVKLFICVSIDQATPAVDAFKRNTFIADRKLDKTM